MANKLFRTFVLCTVIGLVGLTSSCTFFPFWKKNKVMIDPAAAEIALQMEAKRIRPASTIITKRGLTLAECRSIALATNLELQAARLEEMSQAFIRESNRKRIAPHVVVNSELSRRSSMRWSYSDVMSQEGGRPGYGGTKNDDGVTNYSTGHERSTGTVNLETRWSPTDAGLAYYLMWNNHNDTVRAHWAKVRAAQKLVETIESAFFRLLSLQQCLPMAQELATKRASVKSKHDQLLKEKLSIPEEFFKADQKRIAAERLLTKILNQIEYQRNILASAMGITPDQCEDGGFFVIGELPHPVCPYKPCEMELVAVRNRPEAFQAGLNHLSTINDYQRTVIKYFPKLTGFFRYSYDKDKFLFYKEWADFGMYIYYDFLEALANRDESRAAVAKSEKARREIGAVAIGIATQVRTSGLKFFDSMDDLRSTSQSVAAVQKMREVMDTRVKLQDLQKQAIEEAGADLLEAQISRIRALGEANASNAELQSTMGINYTESM